MSDNIDTKIISSEFTTNIKNLEESISRVAIRQTEIQTHISVISAAVQNAELSLQQTKDNDKKFKIYQVISKNVELLNMLYSTAAQFETVRQRYYQEINKVTKDKLHMIHIELRTLDEKFNASTNDLSKFVNELRSLVSKVDTDKTVKQEINQSLNSKEYSMD